jgi:hypothetical protein
MTARLSRKDLISGQDQMQAGIIIPTPPSSVPLAAVAGKAVNLDFEGGLLSSDAGLVLLKDVDEQLGLSRALAAVLHDPRDPRRIDFSYQDLLQQRVFQISAGYEDANDSNTLRHDPIFKLLLNRLPQSDPALASQPTISRFENGVSRTELYRLAEVLMEQFLTSYATPPEVIVLDFDDTEDEVHGAQEQARYNRHYGSHCFLPLHVYEGLSGRLITTILKAHRFTGSQMLRVLKRLIKRLRHAWPDTLLIYRGDSHFAYPEVMQWIEAQPQMHHVTGLTSNQVLHALAHPVVEHAKRAYASRGVKVTRFHSTSYQAGTWCRQRRVVIKVEVSAEGVNTRFVVTSMEQARTQVLYRNIYCARGEAENDIKEHKGYLKSDRTSCHRFEANQFRVLLHSAAYVLLDTLRREVLGATEWARASIQTIQLRLLKLGARVKELKGCIKVSVASSCPVAPVVRRSLALLACVRLT